MNARRLVRALWIACRDPCTPALAKIVAAAVVGYALSPIDLIPDFVPVLGYVDDLVLVPLGLALALRLIPAPVIADCRARAAAAEATGKLTSRMGAAIVVAIWALAAAIVGAVLARRLLGN